MFGFANFLLLALFAAAVFDLIFALARGGGLREALHGLWNTPHLLFGQQLAEWRLQLGRILFAAGWPRMRSAWCSATAWRARTGRGCRA